MCGAIWCHLHWIPALLKRGEIRSKFGIKGNGCKDCLVSYKSQGGSILLSDGMLMETL